MLALRHDEVLLDLEIDVILDAAERKKQADLRQCFECGVETYRRFCPFCPGIQPVHASVEEWAADRAEELQQREGRPWDIDRYEAELARLVASKGMTRA